MPRSLVSFSSSARSAALPAHVWRSKIGSISRAASMSLSSAAFSAGGSAVTSVVSGDRTN
ncbi:hypothetical protein OV079_35535 [Nannocystis pusilla]|uniref:Uncharacterized protein n=1 Tax=Nannocystis pusilla TaxID=889268 RepID=A0A9X3EUZ4_9BACT|nr:hypothetical protein [Nannocystis pusilla]MCY1010787.1 hypothetical protein [Nannocystis pusilla]